MFSGINTVLWTLQVVSWTTLVSAAPIQPVPLLLPGWHHQEAVALVLLPTAHPAQQIAPAYDEGLERTEEGTEGVEDYMDAGTDNDGRYMPAKHESEDHSGLYVPDTKESEYNNGLYVPDTHETENVEGKYISEKSENSEGKCIPEEQESKDKDNTVNVILGQKSSDVKYESDQQAIASNNAAGKKQSDDKVESDNDGKYVPDKTESCDNDGKYVSDKVESDDHDGKYVPDKKESDGNDGKYVPDKVESDDGKYEPNKEESDDNDGRYEPNKEESEDHVSDKKESDGNDGKYVPDQINFDVDESENNTSHQDSQQTMIPKTVSTTSKESDKEVTASGNGELIIYSTAVQTEVTEGESTTGKSTVAASADAAEGGNTPKNADTTSDEERLKDPTPAQEPGELGSQREDHISHEHAAACTQSVEQSTSATTLAGGSETEMQSTGTTVSSFGLSSTQGTAAD